MEICLSESQVMVLISIATTSTLFAFWKLIEYLFKSKKDE